VISGRRAPPTRPAVTPTATATSPPALDIRLNR
jgi:hypothetical protein